MGVNAIYLTPIFSSTAHHRYKTIDHFDVDPLLGGMPAFDRLLEHCRRRGIRVMLDAVFNHVGLGFRGFVDVLEYGKASPWYDWFLIDDWPLNPFDLTRPANYR
ncbi:MAG TPA: alpha-amylase family glycosyl hydrolase, partial [Acidobacteriota bacterium]|nr:alpha-amylase family glycosyl hydrolase [Acidobacteriota bacterium]